ncbi:hypothetical protein [Streptomyces hydrogenans]|uniref:hypothetical protein n=1 Tax=Streptomyces hydrogenans TaxID=1873719 RepID=UPI00380EF4D2
MTGFTPLRATSGHSPRCGASRPAALAERAAGRGPDALAPAGRDGPGGAVRLAAVGHGCPGLGPGFLRLAARAKCGPKVIVSDSLAA